jgi:hypothetical protein
MAYTMSSERAKIEQMFDKTENLRNYPGSYFPALGKAKTALAAWRESHPIEAQAEATDKAERAAQRDAEREADYKSSFIGRGLD